MKIKITLIVLLLIGLNSFSQNNYEKGYIITNDNTKKECYIKNEDWLNTPKQFLYKISLNADSNIGSIKNIKEFGVVNIFKYKRFDVNIDKSSHKLDKLDHSRQSSFVEETLFLKTLIVGSVNLYSYRNGDLVRFFYKKGKESINQLEYKLYKDINNRIGKNLNYLKQLREYFSCNKTNTKRIRYKERDLVEYFMKYNSCNNNSNDNIENINYYSIKSKHKSKFNFYVKLGINFSKLQLSLPGTLVNEEREANFDLKTIFSPGIEIEYQLPFNNNKWAVFIDPSYQSYKSETVQKHSFLSSQNKIYSISYKSLELPLGARYYSFLDNHKTHKLFFNAGITIDIPFNSSATEKFNSQFSPPKSSTISFKLIPNFFLGFGYVMDEKYKIEFRYNASRKLNLSSFKNNSTVIGPQHFWQSSYDTFAVIFSYKLF